MSEVKKIISLLKEAYYGEAWHGPALKELLKDVTAKKALAKPVKGSHSIWELVLHLLTWTEVAWRRLSGETVSSVSPEKDWPSQADRTEGAWKKALENLDFHQQKLLQILDKTDEAKLSENVPGAGYRFDTLLYGTVNHGLYHSGQMAVLKKINSK